MEDVGEHSPNLCGRNGQVARREYCHPSRCSAWIVRWRDCNLLVSDYHISNQRADTDTCRAQSDTLRGMTKKLISKFDPEGWKRVQQMMLLHRKAYFCK